MTLVFFTSISVFVNAQFEFSAFLKLNVNYTKLLPNGPRVILKEPKSWHFGLSEGVGMDVKYKNLHFQLSSRLNSIYINHDKTIASTATPQSECEIFREKYYGRVDQIINNFSVGYNFLNNEKSKLILFLNADLFYVLGKKDKETFIENKHFNSSCDNYAQEEPNYYQYETRELFYADSKAYFSASTHLEYRYFLGKLYVGLVCGVNPFEKTIFTEPLVLSLLSQSTLGTSFFGGIRLGYTINRK